MKIHKAFILLIILLNYYIINGKAQTATQLERERQLEESMTYQDYNPSIQSTPIGPAPIAPLSQGLCILIRLTNQDAWIYKDSKLIDSSRVTTGKKGKDTPKGFFYVINKHKDWTSTIYHAEMPYFLRLNPGDFGLHQGILSHNPSSHGCIRLPMGKAKDFFDKTPIGTKVFIVP